MAGDRPARGGVLETMEEFYKRRQREVADLGREAEAAAHRAYGDAIRSGKDLVLRTQGEVNRFGADLLAGKTPASSNPTTRPPTAHGTPPASRMPDPSRPSLVQQGVDQALAAARGAQDAFTLGLGDKAYAGTRALIDAARGADLGQAWNTRLDAERARDAYDEQHYKPARVVGQIAGTGAQLLALGPAEGLVAGGARIAQATPLIAREVGVLAGTGGLAGVGGQAISDAFRGRLGTLGDYGGAAIGGAVGALAARGGLGSRAGAAMGATTSLAQDALNGQLSAESVTRARDGALIGGVFGAAGGAAGRYASDGLSRKEKELFGEEVSRLRTRILGDTTSAPDTKKVVRDGVLIDVEKKTAEDLSGGGYTIPDMRSERNGVPREIIESKFGRRARLTRRQLQAFRELPNYRVDHTLPRDIGAAVGLTAADVVDRDGFYRLQSPRRSL